MIRNLTVEQNLLFSAMTRLSYNVSYRYSFDLVNRVINLLDLNSIRDQIIGDEGY
jgi:hypothetical protein